MDVVVVAAGTEAQTSIPADLSTARRVVAADSGYDLARSMGIEVDVLVGDLDSVSDEGLSHARAQGVRIVECATDKDVTDLEIALNYALGADSERLVVVGGRGGRLDHQLAVISILAGIGPPIRVEAWMGESVLFVVRDRWAGELSAGAICSVLPWAGIPVVTAEGFRWPLASEALRTGTGRGVSNEALGGPVEIGVEGGVVLVIVDDGEQLT